MSTRSEICLIAHVLTTSILAACGSGTPTAATPIGNAGSLSDGTSVAVPPSNSTPTTPPPAEIPIGAGTAVVVAVGDIGWCGSPGVAMTARLLQGLAGELLLAGDLAYMNGRLEEFQNCFDPDYGPFRPRWRPTPGNHEYRDPGASGYFTYFGDAAGPARRGYYAFDLAAWRVLMINSAQPASINSAQYVWAQDQLRRNRTRCTLAVWHHPYVSSGPNGPNIFMRDMWSLLYEQNAEVVVSGHDHLYERFAPQNVAYEADRERGIRQFIAGTGGAPIYRAAGRFPNSEAIVEAWGALRLTLHPTWYEWEFVNATTNAVADRGAAQCH